MLKGALSTFITQTIGSGLRLEVHIMMKKDQSNKALNDKIEILWKEWGKQCVLGGIKSFKRLEALILLYIKRDGEAFVRLVDHPKKGFCLQLLESESMDENYKDEGKNICGGIAYDEWGRTFGLLCRQKT